MFLFLFYCDKLIIYYYKQNIIYFTYYYETILINCVQKGIISIHLLYIFN